MDINKELNNKLKKLNLEEITITELESISKKENKSIEEIIQNLKYSLNDLEYTESEISKIIIILIIFYSSLTLL